MEQLTVADVVSEMSGSQGFVMFVAFTKMNEKGEMEIQHRYMRHQFIPEDLGKVFENFSKMVGGHVKNSAMDLLQSAEKIVNQKYPQEAIDEAEFDRQVE